MHGAHAQCRRVHTGERSVSNQKNRGKKRENDFFLNILEIEKQFVVTPLKQQVEWDLSWCSCPFLGSAKRCWNSTRADMCLQNACIIFRNSEIHVFYSAKRCCNSTCADMCLPSPCIWLSLVCMYLIITRVHETNTKTNKKTCVCQAHVVDYLACACKCMYSNPRVCMQMHVFDHHACVFKCIFDHHACAWKKKRHVSAKPMYSIITRVHAHTHD